MTLPSGLRVGGDEHGGDTADVLEGISAPIRHAPSWASRCARGYAPVDLLLTPHTGVHR